MIIDGRKIKREILTEVKQGITELPFTPVFCDIMVGTDPVSLQYIDIKAKTARSVGIEFMHATYPETISTEELVLEIKKLNTINHMCGLIVQLPLPAHIDRQKVLDAINPDIDVDCLSTYNQKQFYENHAILSFPTALACMEIIDRLNIDVSEKNIIVMGQGMLVGKPVTHLLRKRGLHVETIIETTANKEALLQQADILITAIGQGKFITNHMVKKGGIIIDAGTSELTGSIVGDVDLDSVRSVSSIVSPTPGGVGPVTVAILLKNVLHVAQQK